MGREGLGEGRGVVREGGGEMEAAVEGRAVEMEGSWKMMENCSSDKTK